MPWDYAGSSVVISLRLPLPPHRNKNNEKRKVWEQSLTHATGLMTGSSTPLGGDMAPSDTVAIPMDRD